MAESERVAESESAGKWRVSLSLAAPHHAECVQLLQGLHSLEQQNHNASTLDRLNRAREKVWCQSLKILQNAHAKRVSEDLVRLFVVAVADLRRGDEKLERILLIYSANALLDLAFHLLSAFLRMTAQENE